MGTIANAIRVLGLIWSFSFKCSC